MFNAGKVNREISFIKSISIILFLFVVSISIIYYTASGSQAIVNNYSGLMLSRANEIEGADSTTISLLYPKENDIIERSFVLTGQAKVTEKFIYYRLLNDQGNLLLQGIIPVIKNNAFFPFSVKINLADQKITEEARIELFTIDPADGSAKNYLSLPVYFHL
jgi:hypothetical protein